MNVKVVVILWMLATLSANAVRAQDRSGDEELHLQQVALESTLMTHDEATSLILQRLGQGDQNALNAYLVADFQQGGNFAFVQQDGGANVADVAQIGLSNVAVMQQIGIGNLTLLEQLGNRNVFGAWLTGDNNRLSLRQQGDDNVYILDFVGDDQHLGHSVDQVGNNLQAVQIGAAAAPYSIQQRGNGMEIRVEHNAP